MPDYNFDDATQRWRDYDTGRFVTLETVENELNRHIAAAQSNLQAYTRQLYAGEITIQQWQVASANELSSAHIANSMFAVGGRRNMTQANYGRVGGVLADEYRYLSNFANEIASGLVSEAKALARIAQYGRSTRQSYWREYAQSSTALIYWLLHPAKHCTPCLELAAGSPYTSDTLPTYPGAGDTDCRGNCNCSLERRDSADITLTQQNQRIAAGDGVSV